MLVISEETQKAFDKGNEANFQSRLETFLKAKIEDLRAIPSEEILPQIEILIARSRSYGLVTERDIATFALTAGFLGLNFDLEMPAPNAMLGATDVSSEEKRIWLENYTTAIFEALEE